MESFNTYKEKLSNRRRKVWSTIIDESKKKDKKRKKPQILVNPTSAEISTEIKQ
jgi:hypothetical protein